MRPQRKRRKTMNYYVCKEQDYSIGRWSGGTTTQLAIHPAKSSYLDRNFVWRLSSATVDVEESDFTKLPDYDRVLMVLKGETVLSYEGERVVRLKELEQDRFDGAWKTKSFGKITDFNLMVRKGNEGYLDVVYPKSEKETMTSEYEMKLPLVTHALYCKEGYLVVGIGGETQMVQPGQLIVMEFVPGDKVQYSVMGEGTAIRAQIFAADMNDELYPVEIPPEKATFDDFKACVYLANIQFRLAKYMIKSLKTTWFDEQLSGAIRKLERLYVTFFVFIIGLVTIASMGAMNEWDSVIVLLGILAWILVDCLLISPLIYFAVMPKPVRKHIKDIDKLTPYEQKVREAELGRNERAEKILKKYKNSGRYTGL